VNEGSKSPFYFALSGAAAEETERMNRFAISLLKPAREKLSVARRRRCCGWNTSAAVFRCLLDLPAVVVHTFHALLNLLNPMVVNASDRRRHNQQEPEQCAKSGAR
jgi:hypothetical protein